MQCAFVFTIKWELRKLSTQRMLLLVSGFGLCGCWSQWRPPRPLFSLGPRCQLSPRATLQHPVHQPIQRQRSIPADSMAVIAKLSCAGICIVIVCTALRFYDINAFIAANGETPFTRVPSFDHWRILVFRCDMFVTVANMLNGHARVYSGILPDLLHICDLAIYPDLFAGSFMIWTDRVTWRSWEEFCTCFFGCWVFIWHCI